MDDSFIENYIKLHGQVGYCIKCNRLIGRINAKCPTCGNILDIENTYPALEILPQEKWIYQNV